MIFTITVVLLLSYAACWLVRAWVERTPEKRALQRFSCDLGRIVEQAHADREGCTCGEVLR